MDGKAIKVLLVEDNPGDARLIREMLAEAWGRSLALEWVPRLAEGLERLKRDEIDLVLLDLDLPDSSGLDTFLKAHAQAPGVPFVVLTGLADETLAFTAVRQGAQDYLFKGEINPQLLRRAIRYARERKQAELALEAERKKLFAVLNSIPAFVHLKGADFKIRFANRRFQQVFGNPGNTPCYELLGGRSEPCAECHSLEVLKTGVPQQFEWTNADNTRTYEIYHYPFCSGDEPQVLTLGIDITERKEAERSIKESEEQLTAIYTKAPLLMMLVDGDRRVCKANKLAEHFAGVPADELLGKRGGEALRCLHALDDPQGCGFGPSCQHCAVRLTVMDTYETGRSHHQVEACLPFAIGGKPQDVTFLLYTTPLSVRGQRQVLVTIQDITARKQAQHQLQESEQNLRYLASQLLTAQERERKRISRELHDELGQSLMTLKLGLHVIERKVPQELSDIRQDLHSKIGFINNIVEDVRRLSRDLRPSILEDLGLTTALKRLFEDFAQRHGVTLSLEMDDIDDSFSSEGQLIIYRLFQESLTNIAKHAEATRVMLRVNKTNGRVDFCVEDNGRGFALPQAAAPDPSRKGIGLVAMEERMRMAGGFLEIRSQEGQGTRISFSIPIVSDEQNR
jgi:signal transduction histidine kinase/DNA-binding response OmpR family regulator